MDYILYAASSKFILRLRDFVKPNGFSRRKFNILKKKKNNVM